MITDWASRRVALTPDRPAIIDGISGTVYTYAAVAERVRRLAELLDQFGVRRGDRVAIVSRNHLAHVDLWLGAGYSGITIWPANWRLSTAELIAQAAGVRPRLILYERAFKPVAEEMTALREIPALGLEEYEAALSGFSGIAPDPADPKDPAMLLFTGGSTGRPKAVRIPHRQIFYNAVNTLMSWQLGADDRALVLTPFYHTGGYHVLTTPLFLAGGTSVLFPTFDPGQVLDARDRWRVTVLFMVPTMFHALCEHPAFKATNWTGLKFAIAGGAPCPESVRRMFEAEGIPFRQGYGLTEVGPNCFAIPEGTDGKAVADAVGVPVFHLTTRIVDPGGQNVRPGEVGELWLKGPTVADGYDTNPGESAQYFDQDGYFHTGDLARLDEAGLYHIVGRQKDLFISGGENVYPGEVETAVNSIPGVWACAVVGVPDERWGEVGAAFVVAAQDLTADAVRQALMGQLARYKIPRYIHFVDALPLTGAGKIDKHGLRSWRP